MLFLFWPKTNSVAAPVSHNTDVEATYVPDSAVTATYVPNTAIIGTVA